MREEKPAVRQALSLVSASAWNVTEATRRRLVRVRSGPGTPRVARRVGKSGSVRRVWRQGSRVGAPQRSRRARPQPRSVGALRGRSGGAAAPDGLRAEPVPRRSHPPMLPPRRPGTAAAPKRCSPFAPACARAARLVDLSHPTDDRSPLQHFVARKWDGDGGRKVNRISLRRARVRAGGEPGPADVSVEGNSASADQPRRPSPPWASIRVS